MIRPLSAVDLMADAFSLTRRQAQIAAMIAQRVYRTGIPPTVREIQQWFKFASPTGVACHLRALERKGAIRRGGKREPRTIVPNVRFILAGDLR